MPITQDRMIEVILAGSDFQQAYNKTMQAIVEAQQKIARGENPQAVLQNLETLSAYAVENPGRSAATLEYEAVYYRRHKSGNVRRAAKQRLKRGETALPAKPKPSAYQTISHVAPSTLKRTAPLPSGATFGISEEMWEKFKAEGQAMADAARGLSKASSQLQGTQGFLPPEALAENARQLAEEEEEEAAGFSPEEESQEP